VERTVRGGKTGGHKGIVKGGNIKMKGDQEGKEGGLEFTPGVRGAVLGKGDRKEVGGEKRKKKGGVCIQRGRQRVGLDTDFEIKKKRKGERGTDGLVGSGKRGGEE